MEGGSRRERGDASSCADAARVNGMMYHEPSNSRRSDASFALNWIVVILHHTFDGNDSRLVHQSDSMAWWSTSDSRDWDTRAHGLASPCE